MILLGFFLIVHNIIQYTITRHQICWKLQIFSCILRSAKLRNVQKYLTGKRLTPKPSSIFTDRSKAMLLLWSFLIFTFCACHAVLCVHCSLVVTCGEMANLFALLCVMLSWVFDTFPCGVLGQVWYLIVSILGLCLLPYFINEETGPVQQFFSCLLNV